MCKTLAWILALAWECCFVIDPRYYFFSNKDLVAQD